MKRFAFWVIAGFVIVGVIRQGRHGGHRVRDGVRQAVAWAEGVEAEIDGEFAPALPEPPEPPKPPKPPRHRRPAGPIAAEFASSRSTSTAETVDWASTWSRSETTDAPATPAAPRALPDWFPRSSGEPGANHVAGTPIAARQRAILGPISSTEAKARDGLRKAIDEATAHWIAGDVPAGWRPPARLVDRMIVDTHVQPILGDLGDLSIDLDEVVTLHRAGALVDFSPARRDAILAAHRDELVRERMVKGGGILAAVLVALAAFSGYVRADEATKGYFTNRLRLLAAAGLGAAGVVAYRTLA